MAAKEKRFQWNKGDKIENRILCLANFKAKMEYNNSDFNADKVKQYEAAGEAMSRIYEDEPTFFGPSIITPLPVRSVQEKIAEIQQRQKIDKELIKKGYSRVQEKLKEIRKNLANAVTTGSRSGSRKIVLG